jgi:aminoglycoside 6'-N-acetyltransferase
VIAVTLRPLDDADRAVLEPALSESGVREWWGTDLVLDDQDAFTILADGEVAGWLGWYEEETPDYRHGGLDIFLTPAFQGRGIGREALLQGARFLIARGHHRIIIDPAAHNARAIAVYASIGFKPVGIMRRYERGGDGTWHDGLLMDLLAEELSPT